MTFSFSNEVVRFLKENYNKYYTAREIALHIANAFSEDCDKKIRTSKDGYLKNREDCIVQWMREIYSSKNTWVKKGISITAGRPRKYYYIVEDIEKEKKFVKKMKKNIINQKKSYIQY